MLLGFVLDARCSPLGIRWISTVLAIRWMFEALRASMPEFKMKMGHGTWGMGTREEA